MRLLLYVLIFLHVCYVYVFIAGAIKRFSRGEKGAPLAGLGGVVGGRDKRPPKRDTG